MNSLVKFYRAYLSMLGNNKENRMIMRTTWPGEREPRLSLATEIPENPVINCLRRLSGVNTKGRERESPWVKARTKVQAPLTEVFPRHDAAARRQFSQFCGDCTAGVTLQV